MPPVFKFCNCVARARHLSGVVSRTGGRNCRGRVPDASRTIDLKETDTSRTRPQPFIPGAQGEQDMPAPRPRHASATPAPPRAKKSYSPRHARAMPAPLSCSPRNVTCTTMGGNIQNSRGAGLLSLCMFLRLPPLHAHRKRVHPSGVHSDAGRASTPLCAVWKGIFHEQRKGYDGEGEHFLRRSGMLGPSHKAK
eukprot:gene22159-biopygen13258